jgi:hypothetical protein
MAILGSRSDHLSVHRKDAFVLLLYSYLSYNFATNENNFLDP